MRGNLRLGPVYTASLVALLLIFFTTIAYASHVIIDDFDEGEQFVCDGGGCVEFWPTSDSIDVPSVLGGERDVVVARTGGSGSVSISIDSGPWQLSFSDGASANSQQ